MLIPVSVGSYVCKSHYRVVIYLILYLSVIPAVYVMFLCGFIGRFISFYLYNVTDVSQLFHRSHEDRFVQFDLELYSCFRLTNRRTGKCIFIIYFM